MSEQSGSVRLLEAVFGCRFGETVVLPNEAEVAIRLVLRRFSCRAERVLRLRFGIDCKKQSLVEVGAGLPNLRDGGRGITRERVRMIERNLLRIIRWYHWRMLKPDADLAFGGAVGIPRKRQEWE